MTFVHSTDKYPNGLAVYRCVIHLAVCGLVYHSVTGIKMSLPYSCCIWTNKLCSCYYKEKYTIKL